NAQMMQTLAGMYLKGQIKPQIDQTLPMQELPQAFAVMGSRSVKGKLVLVN
ncbi:MAG: NADPH2:quinone reductase, partial [Hydrogenophaga sp.]